MAELPPKIPMSIITQKYASYSYPNQLGMSISNYISSDTTSCAATVSQQQPQPEELLPSWADEFFDFSSARRGSHRRSASDSMAFLDTTTLFLEECPGNSDDQFISFFSDHIALPLLPSDEKSNNDDDIKPIVQVHMQEHDQKIIKNEAYSEVESSCRSDGGSTAAVPPSSATLKCTETIKDPKRVKRILANRQSAQRSRVRKLHYISELERSVTSLQKEVSALSPRVSLLDHQRLLLTMDNSALKQRIAALAQDKIFKHAHQEALKKEIERLRQIQHQQNLQKMGNSVHNNGYSFLSPTVLPTQPQPPLPPHSASAAANSISAFGM